MLKCVVGQEYIYMNTNFMETMYIKDTTTSEGIRFLIFFGNIHCGNAGFLERTFISIEKAEKFIESIK